MNLAHTSRPLATVFTAVLLATIALVPLKADSQQSQYNIDAKSFTLIERESGPVNYYTTMQDGNTSFVRSAYHPPMKTAVVGIQLPTEFHQGARKLRWKWRAQALPNGGNECQDGKGDSAAVVYLTWRSGLRWYCLKYVWSGVGPKGAVCDKKRRLVVAQDTVILRSGGPLNTWVTEEIDPTAEFQRHFRDGDMNASVPDLMGIGLMSDGDQTHSDSSADFADFSISH
jgi:hypothetical protein